MNGIEMSMDGIPAMEGTTWYHRNGKSHFTVRDIVSDGSQMIVRTTDGRMIPFDVMNDYIQSETPITSPRPKVDPRMGKIKLGDLDGGVSTEQNKPGASMTDGLSESTDGLLEEDLAALGNFAENPTPEPPQPESAKKPIPNYAIIEKALSKVVAPKCNAIVNWESYPERELELLMSVMDIPAEDIAEYIYDAWFKGKVKDMIVEQISLELKND